MAKELDDVFNGAPADEDLQDDTQDETPPDGGVSASEGEDDAGDAASPRPQRTVPLQALDEARLELRRLKDDLTLRDQKIERMNQRFEDFIKMVGGGVRQQQQPKEELPSLDEEPVANIDTRLKKIEQIAAKSEQMALTQAEMNALGQAISRAEQAFRKTKPDYFEALAHVRQMKMEVMAEAAPWATEAELIAEIQEEEIKLARSALANGHSPAEAAYRAALKYGYQPKTAGKVEAGKKIEQLKKGVAENKSLSDVPGVAQGRDELTLESLAELEGEEFSRAFDKLIGGGKRDSLRGMFRN